MRRKKTQFDRVHLIITLILYLIYDL